MMVSGAIFVDRLVVQRLTPNYVYLGPRPCKDGYSASALGMFEVAKLFRAIKRCTETLKHFYMTLGPPTIPFAFHIPHFQEYFTNNERHEIKYLERLCTDRTDNAIFKAEVTGGSLISASVIVKFTPRYGHDAHKLLAKQSLAPALYYCAYEETIQMVVVIMEYIDGDDVVGMLPTQYVQSLRHAIKMLHEKDMVFGDLRAPNILVKKAYNSIRLIDFDWSGPANKVFVPADINQSIEAWPEGTRRMSVISKKHDEHMFYKLTGKYLYGTD